MNEAELVDLLSKTGALMDGHFLLSSGLHSNRYVQCAKLLQYPDVAELVGLALAEKLTLAGVDTVNFVASPAIGGIIVGQEVARSMGIRHIFVEKDKNGTPKLRRGFEVAKGEKFIIAEDVITTGKSTNEVMEVIGELGGELIAVVAIVDRSAGRDLPFSQVPLYSLAKLDISTYTADQCPLCDDSIPLVKPGSRTKIE